MNGNGSKIEIFKPFGDSFELMKKILFQPFDFKKWLIIGFAAWLANLGSGGGGGSFNYPENRHDEADKLNEMIGQIPHPVLITGICVLICVVLLLIVLFAWLRARGRFMLVDCIVRNRAAVVEPWKEFRPEGNSFFLFSLLVVVGLIIVIGTAGAALIVPFMPWGDQAQPGIAFWVGLSLFLFIAACLAFIGSDLTIDGPDHVSATLSRTARIFPSPGPDKLPSWSNPSLHLISYAIGSCSVHDQLRGNMRDLLHRCDSVCRHGYTFTNSNYARSVFVVVPSAVWSELRCMGRLHAAGIFACFVAPACAFGNWSKLGNAPNYKIGPHQKTRRIISP